MKKFSRFHKAEFLEGLVEWYLQHENLNLQAKDPELSHSKEKSSLRDVAYARLKSTRAVAFDVAKEMEFSFESLFSHSYDEPMRAPCTSKNRKTPIDKEMICEKTRSLYHSWFRDLGTEITDFIPTKIYGVNYTFTLEDIQFLYDCWGNISSAVCLYICDDGSREWIPATLKEVHLLVDNIGRGFYPRLFLGQNYKISRFLNEHHLENHRRASITFPVDWNCAISLSKLYSSDEDNVITGCWGEETSWDDYTWNLFDNRKVYLLPTASRESFLKISSIADKLNGHARSIWICPQPLTLMEDVGNPDAASIFERYLATDSVFVAQDNKQSLTEAIRNAPVMNLDEFKIWLNNMGLLDDHIVSQCNSESNACVNREALAIALANKNATPTLDEMMTPSLITGIIGDSDAGKGMLAYSFSVAMGCHFDILGMKAEQSQKVLYFDAETNTIGIDTKIERIRIAYGGDEVQCDKNIRRLSLLEEKRNLLNVLDQKFFEQHISAHNPDMVIFDNLLSLADGVWNSAEKAKSMFDWFRALSSRYKVAVVYCHHTGKDGKTFGSSALESLSQNVILIRGREHLYKVNPSLRPQYEEKPGCLCEITFKKMKAFPSLLGKQKTIFLDYHEEAPTLGNQWIEIENEQSSKNIAKTEINFEVLGLYRERLGDKAAERPTEKPRTPEDKEKWILWYAAEKFVKNGSGWFTRKEIDDLFESTDEDKRSVLKRLVGFGWLNIEASGKNKKYQWRV